MRGLHEALGAVHHERADEVPEMADELRSLAALLADLLGDDTRR